MAPYIQKGGDGIFISVLVVQNRAALQAVIGNPACNRPSTQRGYYEVERGSLAAKEKVC